MCLVLNNDCPECVERLEEGIIIVLIQEAQGAYFEAQGADYRLINIGGKAHTCKLWIVKRKTLNSI